ncbi:MAG: hypothetical protein ACI4GD_00480 [Lachnospiraceae bacterium]
MYIDKQRKNQNGIYYGLDTTNLSKVFLDRSVLQHPNGLIIGSSGTEKHSIAKNEIETILTETSDVVYIIDPTQEYISLENEHDSEVIRIHRKKFDAAIKYIPSLEGFYETILNQELPEIQGVVSSLEYKGNVNTEKRLIIIDVSYLPHELSVVAQVVCLNAIMARITENHRRGIRSWLYINHLYMLLCEKTSAHFLRKIWLRTSKCNCILTGITQSMEDLLKSEDGHNILKSCGFVMMLDQSTDLDALSVIFDLSVEEQQRLSGFTTDHGLIYVADDSENQNNRSFIPFTSTL